VREANRTASCIIDVLVRAYVRGAKHADDGERRDEKRRETTFFCTGGPIVIYIFQNERCERMFVFAGV
jgi:hypothetical protein